jgi:hypothetical protein
MKGLPALRAMMYALNDVVLYYIKKDLESQLVKWNLSKKDPSWKARDPDFDRLTKPDGTGKISHPDEKREAPHYKARCTHCIFGKIPFHPRQ